MLALFTLLCLVLVLAIAAIAIWLWLCIDIVRQITELVRIRIEEQIALWRIESLSRIAQREQQFRTAAGGRDASDEV